MKNKPLISVTVVTYNSAEYIIDTLESVKAQTYSKIELIISDDCSKDRTVELCRKWLVENKDRFERIELIESKVNTGVSGNLNRAEAACRGEWVKYLDGDDLLVSTCLEDYVEYVTKQPDTIYLFSRGEVFGASEELNQYYSKVVFDCALFRLNASLQYKKLLEDNTIMSSTCMYHRQKNEKLGIKNDERIPLLEDWPRWINVTKKGVKLSFLDKIEVRYRLRENSLSTSGKMSEKYYRSIRLFCFYYLFPVWYKENPDNAIERVVNQEADIYHKLLTAEKVLQSKPYRLGQFLLTPLLWLKKIKILNYLISDK